MNILDQLENMPNQLASGVGFNLGFLEGEDRYKHFNIGSVIDAVRGQIVVFLIFLLIFIMLVMISCTKNLFTF